MESVELTSSYLGSICGFKRLFLPFLFLYWCLHRLSFSCLGPLLVYNPISWCTGHLLYETTSCYLLSLTYWLVCFWSPGYLQNREVGLVNWHFTLPCSCSLVLLPGQYYSPRVWVNTAFEFVYHVPTCLSKCWSVLHCKPANNIPLAIKKMHPSSFFTSRNHPFCLNLEKISFREVFMFKNFWNE